MMKQACKKWTYRRVYIKERRRKIRKEFEKDVKNIKLEEEV